MSVLNLDGTPTQSSIKIEECFHYDAGICTYFLFAVYFF